MYKKSFPASKYNNFSKFGLDKTSKVNLENYKKAEVTLGRDVLFSLKILEEQGYISKSNEKTNLYVFLTPTVIYSPSDATSIYKTKHKEISIIREGSIKLYEQEHIMP